MHLRPVRFNEGGDVKTASISDFPQIIHISMGGPMRKISVGGRIIEFEMHPYCGPNILHKRTGEPLANQPMDFLHAASLWHQQGQRIDENGLCVWFHDPEDILEHKGGRHYLIVGQKPAKEGN